MTRIARRTTHHTDTQEVELEGVRYGFKDLSDAQKLAFGMKGFAANLIAAEDTEKRYKEIVAGAVIGRAPKAEKPAKAEKLSIWKQAAANVHAEACVRGRMKAGEVKEPGKKVRDMADFGVQLAAATAMVKTWTKEQVDTAKMHPLVIEEYRRLKGISDDLSALFAAPVEAAPELAVAAE